MSNAEITQLTDAYIMKTYGRLPLAFVGVIGGQLFEMLVSRIVAMPTRAYAKADRPASYWRWVAFHAAILVVLIGLVIAQRTHFIIL